MSKKFIFAILMLITITMPTLVFAQQYRPLANYGDLSKGVSSAKDLDGYLNLIFKIMIASATLLAVIMIIVGGLQYMTADSIGGKGSGKQKITSAIGGLILALSSYLILYTINPNLLKIDFTLKGVGKENKEFENFLVEAGKMIESTGEIFESVPKGGRGESLGENVENSAKEHISQYVSQRDDAVSPQQRVLESAKWYADNKISTKDASGGGNLACADAVCSIINSGYGEEVIKPTSTTITLNQYLSSSNRFSLVEGGISNATEGDIIISPTSGDNHGHVGVISRVGGEGGGRIISNSSSQKAVLDNYSFNSWTNRYEDRKGLPTYIYRPQ